MKVMNRATRPVDAELRKRIGQFFTDPRIALLLAHLAEAMDADSIIDPMAGTGVMLRASLEAGATPKSLGAIEIEPGACATCRSMLIDVGLPADACQVVCGDAFNPNVLDPLGLSSWDLVITNPPYVRYQRTTASKDVNFAIPSASQVREGLTEILATDSELSPDYRDYLLELVSSYSGLADLAVPAWILCAALVKEGGILAMVVPDTWLSRDYARPIRALLTNHFETLYVIEDGDASWFPDALVRTHLIVARRSDGAATDSTELFMRLSGDAATEQSIVGNLFPGSLNPELDFAQAAREWRKSGKSESTSGLEVQPRSVRRKVGGYAATTNQPASSFTSLASLRVSLPDQLAEQLPENLPGFTTLDDLGWQVGQGLRTGANSFFYVEVISEDSDYATVQPDKRFSPSPIQVPSQLLRRVIRKQSDLPSGFRLDSNATRGRVIVLRGYALPSDLKRLASRNVQPSEVRPVPEDFASYIGRVATTNIGSEEAPRFVPQLSAVVTNIKKAGTIGMQRAPGFWYQLPPFADRHRPNLLIARVNHRKPRVLLNPDRVCLVDANFSTLWQTSPDSVNPSALLALFNSMWARLVMESAGTVLGGGALKIESTHLRSFPIPATFIDYESDFAAAGTALVNSTPAEADKLLQQIDELAWSALGLEDPSLRKRLHSFAGVLEQRRTG